MGNRQTNLKIDRYFNSPILHDSTPISIVVKLPRPAITNDGSEVNEIFLLLKESETLSIFDDSEASICDFPGALTWSPKSHLRDFEVISPFTSEEIKIGRQDGIGVVVVEPLQKYIKLYYDENSSRGISPVFTVWNHSLKAKEIFSSDLALGYDLLMVTKGRVDHLCEEVDERDQRQTPILFPEFKALA